MQRLFFALWPDEAASERLARLADELAGDRTQAVPAGKIHLTLAFLGMLPTSAWPSSVQCASKPWLMRLDCVGAFRKVGVAWAGAESPPPELLSLQSKLMRALGRLGFSLEERAYVPHVTLVRKVRDSVARAGIEPIEWPAGEVTLMRSDTGTGRYTRLSGWHLRD